MLIELNKDNFEKEVLQAEQTVLVDFWATWCNPCKMLMPVVEEFAEERKDIKVCTVDVDANLELLKEFGISVVPTLIVFKDGKEVNRGVNPQIKSRIEELVK